MKTRANTLSGQETAQPFMAHSKRLLLCVLLLLVLIGTGCDSNDMAEDEPRVLAGVWRGSITHVNPNFNGTMTLTITQAGDALGGTANWRFSNRGISGIFIGNATEQGPLTYTLDFGEDGTYLHQASLRGDDLTGTWVSARSNGINGTVSLQRQ